jgi:hypothetical protein
MEGFFNLSEPCPRAQDDVLPSEHEPGARNKSTMRRACGQHKDLAASKNPLLPRLLVSPHGAGPQHCRQVLGRDILVPLLLECNELERGGVDTRCNAFVRKPSASLRQQRNLATSAAVEQSPDLDGNRAHCGFLGG